MYRAPSHNQETDSGPNPIIDVQITTSQELEALLQPSGLPDGATLFGQGAPPPPALHSHTIKESNVYQANDARYFEMYSLRQVRNGHLDDGCKITYTIRRKYK